jgi:glutamate formiminotransferase / 5-formyltetrahydrofolate cyclo-ligase
VIGELRSSLGSRIALLDEHSDPVHNRTVFTLAGDEAALLPALVRLADLAVGLIDITRQVGAHPRIGSLDVCPIVWHHDSLHPRAVDLARAVAERLGTLALPVFLYGELASTPERRERAHFRRGGHVELTRRMREGDLSPDYGPGVPHPTGGGVLVTARPPLAAFNLELAPGATLADGTAIAAGLRETCGGLPGVRAIAIELGPGRIQISTNVHDPVTVPLGEVVALTARLGEPHGTQPVAAELVGLVPEAALAGWPADLEPVGGDPHGQTIEARLAATADG